MSFGVCGEGDVLGEGKGVKQKAKGSCERAAEIIDVDVKNTRDENFRGRGGKILKKGRKLRQEIVSWRGRGTVKGEEDEGERITVR